MNTGQPLQGLLADVVSAHCERRSLVTGGNLVRALRRLRAAQTQQRGEQNTERHD